MLVSIRSVTVCTPHSFPPTEDAPGDRGATSFRSGHICPGAHNLLWLYVFRARRGFLDLIFSADVGETRYTSQSPEVRRGTRAPSTRCMQFPYSVGTDLRLRASLRSACGRGRGGGDLHGLVSRVRTGLERTLTASDPCLEASYAESATDLNIPVRLFSRNGGPSSDHGPLWTEVKGS